MFVQDSSNTQTTKPEYTDRGLAGAANGASSLFCACTHASSMQTNAAWRQNIAHWAWNPTTTFLLQRWSRHLRCLSNCCLAMTCSTAKLWPFLLPPQLSSIPFFFHLVPFRAITNVQMSTCSNKSFTFCFSQFLTGSDLKINHGPNTLSFNYLLLAVWSNNFKSWQHIYMLNSTNSNLKKKISLWPSC